MIKKSREIIKKNWIMVIGAALMAVSLFYIINNPDAFMASVLSLQEKTFITEKWRDIAYKTNSWAVDIFMSEQLDTPAHIDFTISFDKESIHIDTQNSSGQGIRTIDTPDENSIQIQLSPSEQIDKNQSIYILPFSGDNKNILLSEAVATFANGQEKNLSIWSLNEAVSHTK